MKGPWLVLLVVLLCSELAWSLSCYICSGIDDIRHCQTTQCNWDSSICFKSKMTVATASGKGETYFMSCAPSCQAATQMMQELAATTNPKSEVQDVACCQNDLCNTAVAPAGRSLWALAGGLLFSLGPTLLWALQ